MILIALGSNIPSELGSPRETLSKAILSLFSRGIDVTRQSGLWLTAPVPVSDQNWYHNQVISVHTDRDAASLLSELHDIESFFGRKRETKNEARCLDLDLIAYHDQVNASAEQAPLLPHPRMHERAFVLYPLREVASDWRHPLTELSVDDMIECLPSGHKTDIRRLETTE